MKDICNFIPAKDYDSTINYYHFVYEMENAKLRQPFLHPCYYLYLVVKGFGTWKTMDTTYALKPGSVFFTQPYQSYRLTGTDQFTYLYISFGGSSAQSILNSHGIPSEPYVYYDFSHLTAFWMDAIRRFMPHNANAITESVFMYTLSHLTDSVSQSVHPTTDKFQMILDFINNHYQDPGLSLKSVADMFFYSAKYFSSLFRQKQQVTFSQYLNDLRIQHAIRQMESGVHSISQLAAQCGFSDPLYFTKVFKKIIGKPPVTYLREQYKSSLQD